jgi:ABC-type transporter Mla MlaB component
MTRSTPTTIRFSIRGPIRRADLNGLCERVCLLMRSRPIDVVLCDVHGVEADAVTVDALARLQLAARRHGCQVRLDRASDELRQLVRFMGLRDVLPECGYDASRGGRPKSGNSVSVPRKNVNSAMRPSTTSRTWRAHGS